MARKDPFPEDEYPEIAFMVQRIKEARAELGWNQREFAEKLGVSAGHVGHLEAARFNVTLNTLVGIAQILKKPTSWFIYDRPIT